MKNRWENGKVVQKHLRYVGREADGKTILNASISNAEIEQVKLYGPLLVLDHLAKRVGLDRQLGECAPEILSLVYAHCLDYKSVNQMEAWFERTDLNVLLDIDGVTEKRLLKALDSLEQRDWERLQRDLFQSVKNRYNLKVSGVIYDVTNTYLYGRKRPLGKQGHDKEGVKGRPLIQVGLGVTRDEGVPILHKVFDGNINDSKTLNDLIFQFKPYRIKRGLIIYDRGITSARNIRDVKELQWDTPCGLPVNDNLKKTIRTMMAQNEFIALANRVRLKKTVFYVIAAPHSIDDIKGTLALCFNEQQRKDLRESRYDEILNAQALLKRNRSIKEGLKPYFGRNGNILPGKMAAAEELDGYSCIFTTRPLPKEEMVRLYFDKDLVEKAFRSLKGIIRLQPIRHWLYNRVHAHVFICFLSYLLLSLLNHHLRDEDVSPEEALRELETMYKVYLKDPKKGFRISRVVTLAKKQERILKAISPGLLKT
ncbi:transposase [Candidatus Woesearchaeota archaeon]|nr:transposase [Candidatus Woesearchaeota archaeon]